MAPVLIDAAGEAFPAWPLLLAPVAASLSLVLLVVLCVCCRRAEEREENYANVILTNAVQNKNSHQELLLEGAEEANGEVTNGPGAAPEQEATPIGAAEQQEEDVSSHQAADDEEAPPEEARDPPSPKSVSCCAGGRRRRRRGAKKDKATSIVAVPQRRDSDADDNLYENVEDAIPKTDEAEAPGPPPEPPEARGGSAPQVEPCYAEVRKRPKEVAAKSTPKEKKIVMFKESDGRLDKDGEEEAPPPPPEKTWTQQEDAPTSDGHLSGAQAAPSDGEVLYATVEEAGGVKATNQSSQAAARRPPSMQRPASQPRNDGETHVTYAEVILQQPKGEDPRRSPRESHYATIVGTVGGGAATGQGECFYETVQPVKPAATH